MTQIPLPDDVMGLGEGTGAPTGAGPLLGPVPRPGSGPEPPLDPEPLPAPAPEPLLVPAPEPLLVPEPLAGLDCAPGAGPAAEPGRAVAGACAAANSACPSGDVGVVTEAPGDAPWFAAWRPDGRSARVTRSRLPADGALPWAIAGCGRTGAWVLPASACH
ncbi:MAG TPA: hypothetical protein VE733_24800 [Streptosporangiaceae bacterium]|nr:hypothetical protein [Streptosporangiaceae bacterium]